MFRVTPTAFRKAGNVSDQPYRCTSLGRERNPLAPYRQPMPRVLGGFYEGGPFLMGGVPLYVFRFNAHVRTIPCSGSTPFDLQRTPGLSRAQLHSPLKPLEK